MFSWAMERKAKAFGGPRNALKIGLTGWPGPSPIFTDDQPPRPSLRPGRLPPNPPHLTPGVAASPAHVLSHPVVRAGVSASSP